MVTIISAIFVLGVMGFVFAGLLSLAGDYFKIEIDPRVEAIVEILPGANCGVCGYAGCLQFAEGVAKGEAPMTGCLVGKQAVADKIADILKKK